MLTWATWYEGVCAGSSMGEGWEGVGWEDCSRSEGGWRPGSDRSARLYRTLCPRPREPTFFGGRGGVKLTIPSESSSSGSRSMCAPQSLSLYLPERGATFDDERGRPEDPATPLGDWWDAILAPLEGPAESRGGWTIADSSSLESEMQIVTLGLVPFDGLCRNREGRPNVSPLRGQSPPSSAHSEGELTLLFFRVCDATSSSLLLSCARAFCTSTGRVSALRNRRRRRDELGGLTQARPAVLRPSADPTRELTFPLDLDPLGEAMTPGREL